MNILYYIKKGPVPERVIPIFLIKTKFVKISKTHSTEEFSKLANYGDSLQKKF